MILWGRFDSNEWFVIGLTVLAYAAVWLLPKRVPDSWMILALVWGFTSSTVFDFTIGGGLMDYYVVNDSDRYEITDLFTLLMFAPFGYFFIYFYERLRISRKTMLLYIAAWTVVGVGFQWIAEQMGMTRYQNGYQLTYNIAVFLVIQSITGLFYAYLRARVSIGRHVPPTRTRSRWSQKKPSSIKIRRARKSPI
jgi:hypothetical protein